MFLKRKDVVKIVLTVVLYLIFAAIAFFAGYKLVPQNRALMFTISGICIVLAILSVPVGKYSSGTLPILNAGRDLIADKLLPLDYIKLYESRLNDPKSVVSKPSFEALHFLSVAYLLTDDKYNKYKTVEQMANFPNRKKSIAGKILKASVFFDDGRVAEGDALIAQIKPDITTKYQRFVYESTMNIDRAIAVKDYETAEKTLDAVFSQPDYAQTNLVRFTSHKLLWKICSETGRDTEAEVHLKYCKEHCGQAKI